MANTVVGFFDNAEAAQDAIELLIEAGFKRGDIDVTMGKSSSATPTSSSEAPAAVTGEHAGNAIAKFFHSLFGSDSEEAGRYTRVGQTSNNIVTVHAGSNEDAEQAADLLDEAGAINVDERAAGGAASTYTGHEGDSIQRIEEELQVGKKNVQTGGVRLKSRIIERPVEENLRLREEHVNIERTPVNRKLNADDYAAFEEKNIELTEYAEVPVVSKEARVVEEIRINKEATEHEQTIHDTVRQTKVDIENIDAGNSGSSQKQGFNSDIDLDSSHDERL